MKKPYIVIMVLVLGIAALMLFLTVRDRDTIAGNPQQEATSTPQYECTMEAKICPDGSTVGRTGPNCEFAACPSPAATEATITTYMGGSATALNITVQPKALISDSRCPQDVQCIWAGTVEVRTVISSQVAHGEHTLTLGKPQVFGDYTVTLIKVTPETKAGEEIPESSYRFTFEIKKR